MVTTDESEAGATVYSRHPDVVPRNIAGDALLIPVRGELAKIKRVFVLDPVAEHIWSSIDGTRTTDDIQTSIVASFEIDEETARADLLDFISDLEDAGLIVSTI